MSIFKKIFHKNSNEEKTVIKKDPKLSIKAPLFDEPQKLSKQTQQKNSITEVICCNSPFGVVRIDYGNKIVMVDEKTYNKMKDISIHQGINMLPYAQLSQNEISDVLILNIHATIVTEKITQNTNNAETKIEKTYAICYKKAEPYFMLSENKKEEVKRLFNIFSNNMILPKEIDITKKIKEKLSISQVLERKESMAHFSLDKFTQAIKSAKTLEDKKYANIVILETEEKGEKMVFLLFENMPFEGIYDRGEVFMRCDPKKAVKINYNGGYAWLVLYE